MFKITYDGFIYMLYWMDIFRCNFIISKQNKISQDNLQQEIRLEMAYISSILDFFNNIFHL